MEPVMHIATIISAAAAGALAGAVWQGIVLAACVALGLRLLPKLTAAARSILWTVVLGLVVLLPFVALLRGGSSASGTARGDLLHVDVRWSLVVAGVWAVLSLLRGVQLIRSAIHVNRIARRAVPLEADWLTAGIGGAAQLQRGGRVVEICASVDVDRPSVVGFLRPRILIPPVLLEKLPAAELEQIVLHEMQHLRRRDDWTNLLQKLSLAVFPLNPALLWIERRLCVERELACDDHVLQATGARKAYATCLANLAEHSLLRRGATLALGAWERRSELARRVHRILRRPEERMSPWRARMAMSALALGVVGASVTLARSPELVSFAPVAHASQGMAQADVASPAEVQQASAAFRAEGQTASMMLVKATIPERRQVPAQRHKPRLHPRSATIVRTVAALENRNADREDARDVVAQQAAWVVVTEWHDEQMQPQPRVVPVNVEVIRPAYAAIPMGNGWLIIQI